MMNYPKWLLAVVLISNGLPLLAQKISFSDSRWTFSADKAEVVSFEGRECLELQNGRAVLTGAAFLDGILEYDVYMNAQRSFPGCFFRMQDDQNCEEFYVRPHQSGNPDANQYTPVFNNIPAWQLYHGPAYGKPYTYPVGQWMHVRLVVSGGQAEVYLNNDSEPFLFIPDLMQKHLAGPIGLKASGEAAHFSNFSYTPQTAPVLKGKPDPIAEAAPVAGLVREWEVSPVFGEGALEGKAILTAADKPAGDWSRLTTEATGITNLARIRQRSRDNNTVFVRLIINADRDNTRRLDFGYSDRVRVFCNDRLLYSGDNSYQSRDYRYLGTIGFFDSVYLPLRQGRNEVLLAVSETFGGWGVLARLAD